MTDDDPCGYCRNQIPARSVSDYFCGPGCQDLWHRERSVPIGGKVGNTHLTWEQQAAHMAAVMNGLREAFTDFEGSMRSFEEAVAESTQLTETDE